MDTRTFLFGFGVGAIIVSAFLFFTYLLDRGTGDGERIAQMSNQELVARADELIAEAGGRGIQQDISVIAENVILSPGAAEMTDQEIVDAASELGMIFPTIIVEQPSEPSVTDAPAPAPTDTPVPTPTPTPAAAPIPTPTAAPSAEDQGDSIHVSIPMGATSVDVSALLEDVGVVQDAWYFNRYIMENGMAETLRYGEYDIPKDSTAAEILTIITS
ncbi:MAG: endolytic transglycosylase MltG [Clostridiales bacterium]|nr:endolytic transglycosylase MltG [Clostridiales bacterium]